MSEIRYAVGDATRPDAEGNAIIVHVCNDVGGWGKGFVLALSRRWPEPEAAYRSWYRDRGVNDFALGRAQIVEVEPSIWVANLIGQHGIRRTSDGPPVRYDAIAAGLGVVGERAIELRASVHMPRIGCGLAGGDWHQVEEIVRRTMVERGIPVTVYDLQSPPAP